MKLLKDIIYDKNDVLVALLIICIAGLLIAWRMDVIMDYPNTLAKQTDTVSTTNDDVVPEEVGNTSEQTSSTNSSNTQSTTDNNKPSTSSESSNSSSNSVWNNGTLSKDVKVTIQGGSATEAVQSLVDIGLFKSYKDYENVCKAAGYDPLGIKATTFTLTKGMTQTDIAKKVTQ